MKKIFYAFFAAISIVRATTIIACPQNQKSSINPGTGYPVDPFISPAEEINIIKDSGSAFLNEISIKAIRSFIRDYKDVSDAKWFKTGNGAVVFFTNNGIQTRIFYNKRGYIESTILDYCEDKLPGEIRHLVKSTYYDFIIYRVNEVTINSITAYLVKIQDKTSMKTIKVLDGEMIVTEQLFKSE